MNRETYLSAAKKLAAKGHNFRSKRLTQYANKDLDVITFVDDKEVILSDVEIYIKIHPHYFKPQLFGGKDDCGRYTSITIKGHSHAFFYSEIDYNKGSIYSDKIAPKHDHPVIAGLYYANFVKDRKSAKLLYDLIINEIKKTYMSYVNIIEAESNNTESIVVDDRPDIMDELSRTLRVNDLYKD